MNYTVKYKKIGSFFWRTIKNVKGDGFIENGYQFIGMDKPPVGTTKNIRWFILDDESRLEIPADNTIFVFSKDRYFSIKKNMEQQTGKNI